MKNIHLCVRSEMMDEQGLSPVYLIYRHKGKKFNHFTGIKILNESWDHEKQQIIESDTTPHAWNKSIAQQKEELINASKSLLSKQKDVSMTEIKTAFYHSFYKTGNDFFRNLNKYIEESKVTKKKTSVFVYETLIKDLKLFEQASAYPLSFQGINSLFYNKFVFFLEKTLGNTNNTISKKIKALKAFLNASSQQGLINKEDFESFEAIVVNTLKIALTESELDQLNKLNLSLRKDLATVRDIFLFGCYTGLKYSDIQMLKPEDVQDGFLMMKNQYTGGGVQIPMNNYAKWILRNYSSNGAFCLPTIPNFNANKSIKIIGKMANINELITVKTHKGDQIIERQKKKYELLTTYTSRYTYANLSLKIGMRPELLIQIMGKKMINELLEYNYFSRPMEKLEMVHYWNKLNL